MKFLITGGAGFIGYHLCKSLLEDNYEVLGIDNLNNYYEPKLKLARLGQLKPFRNFRFEKQLIICPNGKTLEEKSSGICLMVSHDLFQNIIIK